MLDITNHQGNTNQNYNEIPPHTIQMATVKQTKTPKQKTENKNSWKGCGEIETLMHCLAGM